MRGELRDELGWTELFFGRHKGKTWDQVAEEDIQYLCWLVDQNALALPARARLREYLARDVNRERILALPEHRRPKDPGQFVLPFGRNRGKTLERVGRDDPAYIEWLGAHWLPQQEPGDALVEAVRAYTIRFASGRRWEEVAIAASTG